MAKLRWLVSQGRKTGESNDFLDFSEQFVLDFVMERKQEKCPGQCGRRCFGLNGHLEIIIGILRTVNLNDSSRQLGRGHGSQLSNSVLESK